MTILVKSFNYLIISIQMLFLLSCVNNKKVEDSKDSIVQEDVSIKKQKLIEDIYYSIDEDNLVTFYVKNMKSNKFKLRLKDSTLLLDSISVYDGKKLFNKAFYKTNNNEFLFKIDTGFGRVNLIGIDSEGVCSLIYSKSESYFFDVFVNSTNHTVYTFVTGYGRNPGPIYVYQHHLKEMNSVTDSLELDIEIINRFDRIRLISKTFLKKQELSSKY